MPPSKPLSLFDQGLRTDPEPAGHSEPRYTFLNRVHTPYFDRVRQLLEAWLRRYPAAGQRDLIARFRSPDDSQMMAAFWELYLHEVGLRLGWRVELHPDVPGTGNHPDFLAASGGDLFYVEGVIAVPGTLAERAAEHRVNQVFDLIDRLDSPNFFLDVTVVEPGPSSPPVTGLRRDLSRWLSGLDPDEVTKVMVSGGGIYSWPSPFEWSESGWEVEFIPIPKAARARGRPGIRPIGALTGLGPEVVDRYAPIRRVLDFKAKHYGELDRPFVVAVLVQENFASQGVLKQVLFGEPDSKLSQNERAKVGLDGFFHTRIAGRVSAVPAATELAPWTVAHNPPVTWRNPYAKRSLVTKLPFRASLWDYDSSKMVEGSPGKPIHEVLGIAADWPGPDKPFPGS